MSNDELKRKNAAKIIKRAVSAYTQRQQRERAKLHSALTI